MLKSSKTTLPNGSIYEIIYPTSQPSFGDISQTLIGVGDRCFFPYENIIISKTDMNKPTPIVANGIV